MKNYRRPNQPLKRRLALALDISILLCLLGVLGVTQTAKAQTAQTVFFDSDSTGRSQIYLQNLALDTTQKPPVYYPLGGPAQLTNAGAGLESAQEPRFSLTASANATSPDYMGRIVYQFGAPGARGLHLIKPLAPPNNGDVQLTPQPLNGKITGGPLKGQLYPCTDVRDPSWSPDGLHIVYSCLEPLASGIGSSYDLWVHDTMGTPDNEKDDADYPLLILNGPLALQSAWSPDGTMIAYSTNAPGNTTKGPTSKIGLISVPSSLGNPLTVFNGGQILIDDACNDVAPAWDPTSTWVAFSSTSSSRGYNGSAWTCSNGKYRTIWKARVNSILADRAISQFIQITGTTNSTSNDTNPGWSTGRLVAFQSDRSNGTHLWAIDSTKSESTSNNSVVQLTGVIYGTGAGYVGTDENPAFNQAGPIGIDISDSAGPVTSWSQVVNAGIGTVVVAAYPGVDGTTNTCCQYTLANLLSAQGNTPPLYTGASVALTFVPSTQLKTSNNNSGPSGYGKWAVDSARGILGNGLGNGPDPWTKLDFVAIDVEAAPCPTGLNCSPTSTDPNGIKYQAQCGVTQPYSYCATQIADAVLEVIQLGGNPIIYTSSYYWQLLLNSAPSGVASNGATVDFTSLWLWETKPDQRATLEGFIPFPANGWFERRGHQYRIDVANQYGIPDLDFDVFDPDILQSPPGSTSVGANVTTSVLNAAAGAALATVAFTNVSQGGLTTMSSSSTGPAPPSGYKPVAPQTYYDIVTTALFSGPIQVCINYAGISFGVQANLALFHYVGSTWTNATSSSNPASNTICGNVTSLSPFAIFEQGTLATPVLTITGGTFAYDRAAHGATASATGVSGSPVSGSFTFTYTPGGSSPPANPGTYSVAAQFTSSDPNYTNASSTGTITITPVPVQTPTTTPTGSMQFARVSHQATLLASGFVLVSGGQSGGTAIAQSELYNPASRTWLLTGSNVIPRFDHTATLLADGRVLATGGVSSTGDCTSNVTAETYDPAKGTWSLTGRLPSPVGTGHISVLLLDGRVLVSGGGDRCGTVFKTAAIFDPSTNKWSATGNMTAPREFHSAALLSDGRVLVAGGATSSPFPVVASAEIYDPKTGVWTAVSSMGTARQTSCNGYTQPYLASLTGGTVLAAGGFSGPNCNAITPRRTVVNLTVNPSPVLLTNSGITQALTVTAQMSDGSTQLFTGPLQFSSANSTIATVNSNGMITSVGTGSTNITVTASGVSSIAPVTVTTTVASRSLTSISASPLSITFVGAGQTQPLAVNGQYSDGSQQALTSSVTFVSSNSAVASVDATGLITSAANGTATITATAQGAPAVQVSVTVKSLVSIAVSPTSIAITAVGQTKALAVTGLFTDGSQQVLTGSLSFISSNPAVARVDLSGNVTAVSLGTATVTVSLAGVTAIQVPVTIAPQPVLLSASPNSGLQGQQNLSVSLTGQFTSWVQGTTTASFGAGITVTALTISSSTTATASLNIALAATPGPQTITLTTGTEVDTLTNGFTVVAQTGVVVSVNPPTGQLGQLNLSVSLTGQFTQWVQSTTTTNFGAGITVSTLTVNSPTSASAMLIIDPTTTIGPRTITFTTGSEVETLINGFVVTGGPQEADAKPFSVLNLAGITGGQPISFETDGVRFSVLNTSGAGGTGGRQSSEVDAVEFSVLNLAGVTGGKAVPIEAAAVPFSVLNTAGPGGIGGSLTSFEVDPLVFSILNLAGLNGNQPVKMEADGVPFSVKNGP